MFVTDQSKERRRDGDPKNKDPESCPEPGVAHP
jgi:hypothetical protein